MGVYCRRMGSVLETGRSFFYRNFLGRDFNVKKVLFVIISIVLIAACLSGCVSTGNTERTTEVQDCGHIH